MTKRFFLLLFALGLLPSSLLRAETPAPSAKKPSFTYLTGQEQVFVDFPKSPVIGSAVDNSDLAIVLAVQNTRNGDQRDEANKYKDYKINLVTEVIDSDFAAKYPATEKLLKAVGTDTYLVNSTIKKLNVRPRPYIQHPLLVHSLFTDGENSYPSGHASGSMIMALVLGSLFPDQATALLTRARVISDSRIVAGVHNPSDIAAGQNLARLVFDLLKSNPKYLKDRAAAIAADHLSVKPTP